LWVAASSHVHTVWHGRWTAVRLAAAAMWCTGWCGDVALAVWGVSRFWALQQEWWHAVGGR
jgi:hypothetical protein